MNFSCSRVPNQRASARPSQGVPGGGSTGLTLANISASVAPGTYPISVTGSSADQTIHNPVTIYLVISTTGSSETVSPMAASTSMNVDGTTYTSATTFQWSTGAVHTLGSQNSTPATAFRQYMYADNTGNRVIAAPTLSSASPIGNCPWTCSGGWCTAPMPAPMPSPAPVISTLTALGGTLPAVLNPGGTANIVINGSHFGAVPGMINFCVAGANPCVLPSHGSPSSYSFTSWTDTQIVASVTLPPGVSEIGTWAVWVTSVAWIAGSDYLNPSRGALEVEPASTPTPALAISSNDGRAITQGACDNLSLSTI